MKHTAHNNTLNIYRKEYTMKTYLILFVLAIFILSSCSTQKEADIAYDDVYYSTKPENNNISKKDKKKEAAYTAGEVSTSHEYISAQGTSSDDFDYGDENTYTTSEYSESEFEMEDYNDYSYAARIRRFHEPNPGYSYYDNYYTNNYYYEYDPWAYGTSIYSNYYYGYPGYYGPSVSIGFGYGGFGIGFGWGYPYYGWGGSYYGWGWPYYGYGWGYPYYGYGWGWGGYYGCYNPCYYLQSILL